MKPVKQEGDRDCLRACIASIMEMDLKYVPEFGDESDQWLRLEQFMREEFLRPVAYPVARINPPYNTYYLVLGTSPRGLRHSCIGLNGKIVHDPHPSNAGLQTIEQYVLFVAFLYEELESNV